MSILGPVLIHARTGKELRVEKRCAFVGLPPKGPTKRATEAVVTSQIFTLFRITKPLPPLASFGCVEA